MLTTETRNGVEIVSLNRPERRNAMVPELMAALAAHLRQTARRVQSDADSAAAQPSALRAVVLTGAGSAFCVGADIKWMGTFPDPADAVAQLVASHHEAVRAIVEMPVPVIAALNGAAAGGGLSLALAADYRIAGKSASCTAAYFRLGLPPDGGNSAFLVRTVGVARAMELLLSNRTLSADEACAWGLVNTVADDETLLDQACATATAFEQVPPETLAVTRRLLDTSTTVPLADQLDSEQSAMTEAAHSQTFRQALQAFLNAPRRRS